MFLYTKKIDFRVTFLSGAAETKNKIYYSKIYTLIIAGLMT